MAQVRILLSDGEGDRVDVRLETLPAIPVKDGEVDEDRATRAQLEALGMLATAMKDADVRDLEVR